MKKILLVLFLAIVSIVTFLTVNTLQKQKDIKINFAAVQGDCNTDNKVDILDFQLLSNSFGKSSGQTGFNAKCDFNTDLKIDVLDFQILSNNFGRLSGTNTPTQGPTPTFAQGGTDYLIINRSDLMALPMSGTGWTNLKAAADASGGSPNLCDQNVRNHPGTTLAAAIVYARTGDTAYYNKAKNMIFAAMPTLVYPCAYASNAALSLGRQLGAYVIAADLIKLNDAGFRSWLSDVRTRVIGDNSHPDRRTLRQTAQTGSHNWSTFCLASVIAADRFLGDTAKLDEDWRIFSGYGVAFGWPFQKSGDFQQIWSCVASDPTRSNTVPISINGACTTQGYNLDGVAVEDASRTSFPILGNYPAESAQGFVLQALLLSRAGYNGWGVNNSQIKRNALARERFGNLNYSNADYYVNWMINKFYGLNQPTRPAGYGRVFGYTDWLYWGR